MPPPPLHPLIWTFPKNHRFWYLHSFFFQILLATFFYFLPLSGAMTRKRKLRGQKKANIKNCKIVPSLTLGEASPLVMVRSFLLSIIFFSLLDMYLLGPLQKIPFSLSISDNLQFVTKFKQWLLGQYSCFKTERVFWSCGLLHTWCILRSAKRNEMILRRLAKLIQPNSCFWKVR